MPDLNSDALGIWEHLKPAIDKEIEQKTRGMVQRRKMKVTTAPSISTGTIGVTEAFGTTEMVIPFATNLISATVGDMVWVEFMYGATNAFASMFASADEKDWDVAGDLTVHGVLDVTQRRCYATLSSQGWYRALIVTGGFGSGVRSFAVDINITRTYDNTNNEVHCVKLLCVYDGNSIFINEVSKSNAILIDKIRYNNDSDGNGFLDIHYAESVANETSVDFTVHANPISQYRFTARPLEQVADSPSGETVMTTYEFSANTYYHDDNVTSGVRHIVDRRGDIVTVTIESSNGINCPVGQYTTVYTLPSELSPSAGVYTVVDAYGGNNIISGVIDIYGSIRIYPVLSSTSYYRFTLTYTI